MHFYSVTKSIFDWLWQYFRHHARSFHWPHESGWRCSVGGLGQERFVRGLHVEHACCWSRYNCLYQSNTIIINKLYSDTFVIYLLYIEIQNLLKPWLFLLFFRRTCCKCSIWKRFHFLKVFSPTSILLNTTSTTCLFVLFV